MIGGEDTFKFVERMYGEDTMSKRAYLLVLTILVGGGLAIATYIGSITYHMHTNMWWIFGYFALAIPGIYMSVKSDNWMVSFVGYLLVIIPTGAIIGPYTALYKPESVLQIALITSGVSIAIGFAGVIYPKSVEHWSGFFLTGLLILIFGDIARMFMVSMGVVPTTLGFWDWVGVVLFCGLIFYDMNKAVRLPKTMDNAVDSAVAVYLDIINLFIRLLASGGRRKD
jgi:FtsH-binding integral membrane protein